MILAAPLLSFAAKGSARKIQEGKGESVKDIYYVAVKTLQSLYCLFETATIKNAFGVIILNGKTFTAALLFYDTCSCREQTNQT